MSRRCWACWATSRSASRVPQHPLIHAVELDLEQPESIETAWTNAMAAAGQFDVVIQNAGAGICGSIEDVLPEESARQWQILVESPLRLLRLAAAHLRTRGTGVIIGVSSLAAEMPLPFAAHYSAGKAALSALLGGLEMELKPFGVRVVDLRPGDLKTSFNDMIKPMIPPGSPYALWTATAWKETVALMENAPGPELAARAILDLIERPRAVARCGTFFQARLGALGVRILPRSSLLDSIRRYYHLDRVDREAGKTK